MDREETVGILNSIKEYLCNGNPIWDTKLVREAIDNAVNDINLCVEYEKALFIDEC